MKTIAERFPTANPTGEKGVRFIPASNAGMGWHDSQWYVLDGITAEAVEKSPNKGWYNTKAQCQKHCDRLNEAEEKAGRFYEKLDNGYVRKIVTEETLHESTDFPGVGCAG